MTNQAANAALPTQQRPTAAVLLQQLETRRRNKNIRLKSGRIYNLILGDLFGIDALAAFPLGSTSMGGGWIVVELRLLQAAFDFSKLLQRTFAVCFIFFRALLSLRR